MPVLLTAYIGILCIDTPINSHEIPERQWPIGTGIKWMTALKVRCFYAPDIV
jgi:hypothetical protein